MINHWQGNSGRVQRLPEPEDGRNKKGQRPAPGQEKKSDIPPPRRAPSAALYSRGSTGKNPSGLLSGLEKLTQLLPGKIEQLEAEDIILLLILYLMYRENGETELLMIMGAMFLL